LKTIAGSGRFLLDTAEQVAEKLVEHLLNIPGVEKDNGRLNRFVVEDTLATSTSCYRSSLLFRRIDPENY